MKTRNTLRHLLGYLALVGGLVIGPALAQGTIAQTLTWTGTTHEILALNVAYPLGATASSGLPVTLRVDAGPAVLGAGTITAAEFGTVVVTAEQPGDATYAAARLTRSFNVRQALLTPVGRCTTGSYANDVQVVGNYAYVADSGTGLQVVDVSNPASPVRVGGYNINGTALGMHVVANYAYVAGGRAGLEVIDVSNPASPRRVSGYDTGGNAMNVQVVGNYAYVADQGIWNDQKRAFAGGGLRVIDVSNPANPMWVGEVLTGYAINLHVLGNYCYVVDRDNSNGQTFVPGELHVIDVRNPANPVRVGEFGMGSYTSGVQLVGNYAYVADGFLGLHIIDVSNPANPVRVGRYDTSGYIAGSVQVVGNYAYVGSRGLEVIDVSNPGNPVRVGGYANLDAPGEHVLGNYAYVAAGGAGLQILELRLGYPQTLTWTGTTNEIFPLNVAHPLGAIASTGHPVTLRVESGPAVIADGAIIVTGLGTVWVRAEQAGNETYLPARETRSFNVRQAVLSRVGGVDTADHARGVGVLGNYAYVVDGARLEVINVSDPASPVRVGGYDTSGEALNVQLVGNYAYVADGEAGLQVIDVSNPASPVRVGGVVTNGYALAAQVAGNYAYLAGEFGLQVIDVSDPANPVRVGGVDTGDIARGVSVLGTYAYVTCVGLQVIDVSNPARPVRVGEGVTSAQSFGVQVVGNFAYVASSEAGLEVFDVSDPTSPVRVIKGDESYDAYSVQVVGNYAFVSGSRLQVIDVSNPANPLQVGRFDMGSPTLTPQVSGSHAYVGDNGGGLQILELRLGYPQTLELHLPENPSFQNQPVPSAVTADSGLPVTLSVVEGPASVVNQQLVLTGLGAVTLRAEQAGDADHLPAVAQWTVTISPPRLGVRLADGQVEVFWAAGLAGLQLQGRASLTPDSPWQDVPTLPAEDGGEARLRLGEAPLLRYFRLFLP